MHEINIRQLRQMRHVLDMFDLIITQVETGEIMKVVQALDMRNEVVVEIEVDQVLRDFRRECDSVDLILTEAYSLFQAMLLNISDAF